MCEDGSAAACCLVSFGCGFTAQSAAVFNAQRPALDENAAAIVKRCVGADCTGVDCHVRTISSEGTISCEDRSAAVGCLVSCGCGITAQSAVFNAQRPPEDGNAAAILSGGVGADCTGVDCHVRTISCVDGSAAVGCLVSLGFGITAQRAVSNVQRPAEDENAAAIVSGGVAADCAVVDCHDGTGLCEDRSAVVGLVSFAFGSTAQRAAVSND